MTLIYDTSLKTLWVSLDIIVSEDDVVGGTRGGRDDIEGILRLEALEVDAGAGEVCLDGDESCLVLLRVLEQLLLVVGVVVGGELLGRRREGRGRDAVVGVAVGVGAWGRERGEGGEGAEDRERGAAGWRSGEVARAEQEEEGGGAGRRRGGAGQGLEAPGGARGEAEERPEEALLEGSNPGELHAA